MSGMLAFKSIKPNALKSREMTKALNDAVIQASKDILFDFEATAWNWKEKVKFERLVSVGPNSVDVLVATDNKIYGYVDSGTPSRTITPKRKPFLAFKVGGVPKTHPGVMVSGAGRPGDRWVRTKKVSGHKIKARKFSKTIQKEWDKKFKTRMEKAMKLAAVVSGHEYQG